MTLNSRLCFLALIALLTFVGLTPTALEAATYVVGPGKPLATIGDVPWATLVAGDTVLIHWRTTPYQEKWVICRQGTAAAPITVSGVPGPGGELPVIDGRDATTAPGLNYWSEVRGVMKIGGANTPPDLMPQHIIIENLEFINAHPPHTFTDDVGNTQTYPNNASGIYLEKGENITIRNCVFRDNGNGLFVASSDSNVSRDILIQGNYLYNNGNVGSAFEHNSYTAGLGMTIEYNHYGPLLPGASGNNLKDRSAGAVVRYNWIESGNRQLDLVDAEDSIVIRTDPSYDETHVYGNILIEPDGAGNRQITHYGGDSGTTSAYRKGTLYFFNNTVVSTRTDRNTLFRLSTNDELCDARNNIFYSILPGNDMSMLDATGVLNLSHNWIKPGWINSFSGSFSGTINDDGTMVTGSSPGFANEGAQDYHLAAGSDNIDAGTVLNPSALPDHNVVRHYVKHQSTEARPLDAVLDIGAYEFGAGDGNQAPIAVASANPASGTVPLFVNFDGTGSSDPDGTIMDYDWDFGDSSTGSGATTNHTYTSTGTFTAALTVTDNEGASATDTVVIVVDPDVLAAPVLSGTANRTTVFLSWTHPGAGSYYYRLQAFHNPGPDEEVSDFSNQLKFRVK